MDNYGYGKLPDVVTSIEFEEMLKKGEILTRDGKEPKNIAIIHCVGSRNSDYHEYCSRTCCMVALKFANQIKSAIPCANVFDLYADMRAFGKGCEEFYTNTSKKPTGSLDSFNLTNRGIFKSLFIVFGTLQ